MGGKILDTEIIHAIFWMRVKLANNNSKKINYYTFFSFHIKILLRKLKAWARVEREVLEKQPIHDSFEQTLNSDAQ
jgi:hypothetical protein